MRRENEPKEEGERGRSFDWSSGLMREKELERVDGVFLSLFIFKYLICRIFYKNHYNDIDIQYRPYVCAPLYPYISLFNKFIEPITPH